MTLFECESIEEWKEKMMKDTDGLLTKWARLINELKQDEEKLAIVKKHYEDREIEIITKTDFNKLYKANNDKIRKYHVRKKLKNTIEQKESLERKIEDSKRKISFLKATTYVQVEIMRLQ